jgi:hypothetical protein
MAAPLRCSSVYETGSIKVSINDNYYWDVVISVLDDLFILPEPSAVGKIHVSKKNWQVSCSQHWLPI